MEASMRSEAGQRGGIRRMRGWPVEPGDDAMTTVDLVERADLKIFQHNVEDHETLLRRIYTLLTGEAMTGGVVKA